MRNPPYFPGGVVPSAFVPSPGVLERWDILQNESVNIAAGGTFSPAEPIVLGGAGLALNGTGGISGATRVVDSGQLVLPSGTLPAFDAPRTMTIVVPLTHAADYDPTSTELPTQRANQRGTTWGLLESFINNSIWNTIQIPQRFIRRGATLLFGRVRFRVATPPSALTSLEIPHVIVGRISAGGTFAGLYQYPTWTATTAYAVGARVIRPAASSPTYRCVSAGTSGASVVGWTTTVGATQTDGSVQWVVDAGANDASALALSVQPYPSPVNLVLADYHRNAAPQDIPFFCNVNNVLDEGYSYTVMLTKVPSNQALLYTGLELTMSVPGLRDP
jgi:hypothetical protein